MIALELALIEQHLAFVPDHFAFLRQKALHGVAKLPLTMK